MESHDEGANAMPPGDELHVRAEMPKLRRKETDSVLARVAAALTRSL